MRLSLLLMAILVLVVATTSAASSLSKHQNARLRHSSKKESFVAPVAKFVQNFRVNRADKKARAAIANGDMEANRKYLARGDELRKQAKIIPAIRLGESAASGNIPGAIAAGAQLTEKHYNRKAEKAVAAHAAAGKTGTSPDAVKFRKIATGAMYAKKAGNVGDVVQSGARAVSGLAKGVVNAGNLGGTASAAYAGAMGAVGLAKQAKAMGLKTNAQKKWGNARTAVKLKGQVMPASGNKPAPVAKAPRAPSSAFDKAGLTSSKAKKAWNAVKACVGKCPKAISKVVDKAQGH